MKALRRAVTQRLRALDRALARRNGRARVLVDARTPMNLAVMEPAWSALLRDSRVDVEFTAEHPEQLPGLQLIPRERAAWRRYDLAINADPWNVVPLKRCWRRVNVFHGVAGKYDLDRPDTLAVDFGIYDRVLFPNEDRLRRYVEAGAVRRERAVLVGFPKTDPLVNGVHDRRAALAALGLDPSLPTVLYAPTFSPASSLHLAGEAIVGRLLAAGRNVVVKLHDRSMVPSERFTAGIDWPARFARWHGEARFAFARGADAAPLLASADVMITDHSTIGFEFAMLDRPLLVFDAPELLAAARINPEKWALLRSMADVVTDVDALDGAVARALAEPGRHRTARHAVVSALFAYPGEATRRTLTVLYELLELEALSLPDSRHEVLDRHCHA